MVDTPLDCDHFARTMTMAIILVGTRMGKAV
jgi:hypothetical protein